MAPRTSKRKATSTPNSRPSDVEDKCYYEILEISKGADETEIRKAYKKLAMKWHPDKNRQNPEKATEMFKLVAEAFEVLSDPEKRDIYDKYGKDGVKNGVSSRNFNGFEFDFADAASIFEQFFGGHDSFMNDPFFNGMSGRNRNANARRGFGGGNPFDMGMGGMGMGLNMGGMFSDFDDGFGSFGNFSSFSSSSFGGNMGGGGGMSKSTRTVTQVVNGKRVTKTETTVTYPDGHTETTSNESTENVGRLGDGRGNSSNRGSGNSKSRLGWF